MKLHLSGSTTLNTVTGYGADYVSVNGQRHERNLILLPDRLVEDWSATSFAALTAADLAQLVPFAPEIVLLGTGAALRFPRPELTRPLVEARIGLEVMDLQAACRTYNILVAESRRVAAALLLA